MSKKTTRELARRAALNLREAADHAAQLGRPLNTMITIHWSATNVGDCDPQAFFRKVIERTRHWFDRNGEPATLIWSHEHGHSDVLHTHILIHIPTGMVAPFWRQLARWLHLDASTSLRQRDGSRVIGDGPVKPLHMRPADRGGLNYLIKDVDPASYGELGIPKGFRERRSVKPIIGKRAGTSRNIGLAARTMITIRAAAAAR